MWHYMWDWDGGWGWFGVIHLLWWVLIIAGAALLFRSVAGRRLSRSAADRSLEILRERFARGEIDEREYEERLRYLRDGPGRADAPRET